MVIQICWSQRCCFVSGVTGVCSSSQKPRILAHLRRTRRRWSFSQWTHWRKSAEDWSLITSSWRRKSCTAGILTQKNSVRSFVASKLAPICGHNDHSDLPTRNRFWTSHKNSLFSCLLFAFQRVFVLFLIDLRCFASFLLQLVMKEEILGNFRSGCGTIFAAVCR